MAHIGVSFSAPSFVLYVKRVLEIIFNRYWHQLGPSLAQFWSHGDHVLEYYWVLFGHLNLRSFRKRILISLGPPKNRTNVMCGIAHWPSSGRFGFPTWGAKGSQREPFFGVQPDPGPTLRPKCPPDPIHGWILMDV